MKTDVAVVIPNWNGADMLKECLQSLEKQTLKAEIIVVDNGSGDNSIEIVKNHFPHAQLIKNSKNLGFACGVNTGIRHALRAKYKYIALLNNDTVADSKWLAELKAEMDREKSCGIVASKVLRKDTDVIDNTGECLSVWGLPFPRSRGEKADSPSPATILFGASGGSTLYRSKMLEEIGLFDEDFFAYYEDADMNLRAQQAGWKARYAKRAVVNHKIGGTSGRVSGFTTYHTLKNLPWMFIKNVPLRLLPKMAPRFVLIYTLIYLKALLSKNFFRALKALSVSILFTPKKLFQRYNIQRSKKVSAGYIESLLYPELPPSSSLRKIFERIKI